MYNIPAFNVPPSARPFGNPSTNSLPGASVSPLQEDQFRSIVDTLPEVARAQVLARHDKEPHITITDDHIFHDATQFVNSHSLPQDQKNQLAASFCEAMKAAVLEYSPIEQISTVTPDVDFAMSTDTIPPATFTPVGPSSHSATQLPPPSSHPATQLPPPSSHPATQHAAYSPPQHSPRKRTPPKSGKGSPRKSHKSSSDDSDSTDGEEGAFKMRHQKRPEARNRFNLFVKQFMKANVSDELAEASAVHYFEATKENGPGSLPVIINWKSPFSSEWNKRAVGTLTEALHAELLTQSDFSYDENTMKMTELRKIILIRLGKKKRARTVQPEKLSGSKKKRVDGRRNTIHKKREEAVEKLFYHQPELQKELQRLLSYLGPAGMSGDETDEEATNQTGSKILRRLRLPWLNQEITTVLEHIDERRQRHTAGHLVPKRGNKSLARERNVRKEADFTLSRPVRKLPINWYLSDWWTGLDIWDQAELAAGSVINIPSVQ